MSSDLNTTESPSPPTTEPYSLPPPPQKQALPEPPLPTATIKDILLWKRKRLNIAAIVISTATWVALEIYRFTFITAASWVAMFVVAAFFIWGNIDRLLGKEPAADTSRMYISQQSAVKTADVFRRCVNQSVEFTLRLGAEREWYVVAAAVAALWVLSVIASHLDLLTLLYIGELVGLTVPVIYNKYEQKINESGQRLKVQYRRYYSMVLQKSSELKTMMLQKTGDLKNKVSKHKEKKRE
ncbi:PREDICTED: reticulon-like protein B13 [Ipomoea nil]|uniref:reticulon-like protein B13 n=1 Tax=Ipomoea nil TaxID=35883 RepID=UPI0009016DF9|nr:PREDICTED: reticulon-like protein B13 [Ipomoea nil]